MKINENIILGLDIGVGSIGWALLETDPNTGEMHILNRIRKGVLQNAIGSYVFPVPEEDKTKEPYNTKRRAARSQRRVIARRADRMRKVRNLLTQHSMPMAKNIDTLHLGANPWQLRKEAISRQLTAAELAIILLHITKHRGFKSNSKRENDQETGKMLKQSSGLKKAIEESGTTVGAYLADQGRQRNFANSQGQPCYTYTVYRHLLEEEIDTIFAKQTELGSTLCTDSLREAFKQIAFYQRPLKSVANMVGNCTFLKGQKRAPRFAPSAEKFILAQKLTNLRLVLADNSIRPLTKAEIEAVLSLQAKASKVTYANIRKIIENLAKKEQKEEQKFSFDILNPQLENLDLVRKSGCFEGSKIFCDCLGDADYSKISELRLENSTLCLDYCAKIISDNDSLEDIETEIKQLPLDSFVKQKLMAGVHEGKFARFKGTANLSLKAIEMILPLMLEYGDYAKAVDALGLQALETDISEVSNHVVQHILREVRKQVMAILNDWNVIPGQVNIELLRDVGQSPEIRNERNMKIKKRTTERNNLLTEFAGLLNISENEVRPIELKRYELWKQQDGKCAYYMLWRNTGGEAHYLNDSKNGAIPVEYLRDGTNLVQIDHILPHSRTYDDSLNNACLCLTSANQAKANKTPYEWLGKDNPEAWHEYTNWVSSLALSERKKANFTMLNLDATKEKEFHARNLSDSAYSARLVSSWFEAQYRTEWSKGIDNTSKRRVFARTGAITNFLRKNWGLQFVKKNDKGERIDDARHHAIDALIVACCTESQLQQITKVIQSGEEHNTRVRIPYPCPDFRQEVKDAYEQIFVARPTRIIKSGELHEETMLAIGPEFIDKKGIKKTRLYKRIFISKLKEADLELIKNSQQCPDIIEALKTWLALSEKDRKLQENLPRSAKGDVIRHVKICDEFTSGIEIKRGAGKAHVKNGSISRGDVYFKDGEFYLVPVYVHQICRGILPIHAISRGNNGWIEMDATFNFVFSLTPDCYIVAKSKDEEVAGYYKTLDRKTGAIKIADMKKVSQKPKTIGVRELLVFKKYIVDRLGRLTEVRQEADPRPAPHSVKPKKES